METLLVSLVSMALIVVSTLAITLSTFKSANKMADAWRAMEERSSTMGQTQIQLQGPADYRGGVIYLQVLNEGHTNLQDFAQWDILVQYQGGSTAYLSYAANGLPSTGQWSTTGIFVTGGLPEVFDPGILNPGEYMTLQLSVATPIQSGQMARVVVSTPNGVTAQCFVTRG